MKIPNINSTQTYPEMKRIVELINDGEERIRLDSNYKNVTLILGRASDGKTLIQWLTTDGENLIAKRTEIGDFIIEDDKTIDQSEIDSKVKLPELITSKSGNAFYDCFNLSDRRSTSHDVASAYFIKKVIDHVESVKLIFVINHSSVVEGMDCENFTQFIRYVTDFFEDIEKFRNSIAIIATNVVNRYYESDENTVLVSDETMIIEIAQFFQKVQNEMKEKLNYEKVADEEKQFYLKTITFLDILMKKDGDTYSRIGIFRMPNKPGPLSDIQVLKNAKQNIDIIIEEKLRFTSKNTDDFSYAISESSKNYVYNLMEKISEDISEAMANIEDTVKQYFQNLTKSMEEKIWSFVNSEKRIEVNPTEGTIFNSSITKYVKATFQLKHLSNLITINDLAQNIDTSLNTMRINTLQDSIRFLQGISKQTIYTLSWENLYQKIATYVAESNVKIQLKVNNVMNEILSHVNSNLNTISEKIINQYKDEGIDELNDAQHILHNTMQQTRTQQMWQHSWNIIKTNIAQLRINTSVIQDELSDTSNRLEYMTYLKRMICNSSNISSPKIDAFLNTTKRNLEELKIWREFLNDLRIKLLKAEIQNYAGTLTRTNIESFFSKIKIYEVTHYENFESSQINELQLQELNDVLSVASKNTLSHDTNDGCLVIKQDSFKLSDLDKYLNDSKVDTIKIFLTYEVIIDTNINKTGKELQLIIIAPKWRIEDKIRIVLDGATAAKANEHGGKSGKVNENDGKPGLPGGRAGNFFGIGWKFVNGASLTITANGGNGSDGENGKDGALGKKGETVDLSSFKSESIHDENFKNVIEKNGYDIQGSSIAIYGSKGGAGEKGGNGGKGGEGGYEGNIKIIELSTSSGITSSMKRGLPGKGGIGGKGGPGGEYGDKTTVIYRIGQKLIKLREEPDNRRGENGSRGKDNINEKGLEKPKESLPLPDLQTILNEYKHYLNDTLEKMKGGFIKNQVKKFYNELESNKNIKNLEMKPLKKQLKSISRSKRSTIMKHDIFNHSNLTLVPRINQTQSFTKNISYHKVDGNRNELLNRTSNLDLNSSLLLLRMFVTWIFGTENNRNTTSFVSPQVKKNMKIEELEQNIAPILMNDQYIPNHDDIKNSSQSSWYRKLIEK